MRRSMAVLAGTALALGTLAPGVATAPAAAIRPGMSAEQAATETEMAPPRSETMTHWSCDRAARAVVTVSWTAENSADIEWKISDMREDGRFPVLRIVGLDFNGSQAAVKRNYFPDDGKIVLTWGVGSTRSNGRSWKPSLEHLDEVEVWIWTVRGRSRSSCGYNITKRLNDTRHSPTRTAPKSYTKSKKLRNRIVAEAWRQYRGVNHESGINCSKYTNAFYEPNICHPWCADFAWWVWAKAGVSQARAYNSSYPNDFRDEWRVKFKTLGGSRKPARGDVIIWSHRTTGINGHIGIVVATDGWRVRVIHGNWSDRVIYSGWINPFTSTQDNGNKHVLGFASPA